MVTRFARPSWGAIPNDVLRPRNERTIAQIWPPAVSIEGVTKTAPRVTLRRTPLDLGLEPLRRIAQAPARPGRQTYLVRRLFAWAEV
jgi:hypothetical protein